MEVFRYYRNTHADQGWDPVVVEEEIEATLGELKVAFYGHNPDPRPSDSTRITARIDLLARANGNLVLVDYKTVGKSWGSSPKIAKWKDDGEYGLAQQQMIQRHLVALRFGKPQAVVIERVKRVFPLDHDANPIAMPALAYEEVLGTLREAQLIKLENLTRIQAGEKVTAHYGPACYGRYGPCDYFDFCRAPTQAARRAVFESDLRVGDGLDPLNSSDEAE